MEVVIRDTLKIDIRPAYITHLNNASYCNAWVKDWLALFFKEYANKNSIEM